MKHEHQDMRHKMPDMAHTHHDMSHDMQSMGHEHHDMNDNMQNMNHHQDMAHDSHMMHMGNMNRELVVSLILTIPLVILSPMMGMKLPFTVTGIPGQPWLVLLIGTILFFYGGQPFLQGALTELKAKKPAMMTLIALGITVAYVYSLYATVIQILQPSHMLMDFFWELATLIDIMLLGHIIEMRAIMQAGSAVSALAQLVPKQAHVQHHPGHFMDQPLTNVQLQDVILVKAYERVPVDGVIINGAPLLDESLLTGESAGVAKAVGMVVVGGSKNGATAFTMQATATAQAGFLAQVKQLVTRAQNEKTAIENLADRVAGWLFYAAVGIGVLTFVFWTMMQGFAVALPLAVTVFIIACPHALGLAIPLVVSRLMGLAAQQGLLIQNRTALEQVNHVQFVLMDKTGTLTDGVFTVQRVLVEQNQYQETDILRIAAALEQGSTHPIAAGIMAAVTSALPSVVDAKMLTGVGVTGIIEDTQYALVNYPYALEHDVVINEAHYQTLVAQGNTVSLLLADDEVIGLIALGDRVKPDAVKFIEELKQMQLMPVMLTGDNEHAAQRIAQLLGISDVHASLKPQDKITLVTQYQQQGAVLMLGDGVNDSPALAKADIGVAIGAGTEVAINAADVVLTNSNPSDVIKLLHLAKQAKRKMTQNLWWGAGYNIIALPLAAGILLPIGIRLDPMVGAAVMSLSTVVVALNALTLRIK